MVQKGDSNPHGFPHHPLKKPIVMSMETIIVYKSPIPDLWGPSEKTVQDPDELVWWETL
jgi:hypothetical protein